MKDRKTVLLERAAGIDFLASVIGAFVGGEYLERAKNLYEKITIKYEEEIGEKWPIQWRLNEIRKLEAEEFPYPIETHSTLL